MSGGEKACDCLECRIREACGAEANGLTDLFPVLAALGNVTAECLAHFSDRFANDFTVELLKMRRKLANHPLVRVQHPEGSA